MIIAILLHESKGGGLATAFGGSGSESAFGASIGRKINRFTAGAVVVFFALSIGLGMLWAKVGVGTANIQPRPAVSETMGDREEGIPDEESGQADPKKGASTPEEPGKGSGEASESTTPEKSSGK
jgi:protein translocase SecG subunit